MKKIISFLLLIVLILLISGCGQIKAQPISSATVQPAFPTPVVKTSTKSPLPTSTSTLTATPKPTVTNPPTLQAQWLTLPAPTISSQNITNLEFQTALSNRGITRLSPDGQFLAWAAYSQLVLYDFKTLKEIMRYQEDSGPGES